MSGFALPVGAGGLAVLDDATLAAINQTLAVAGDFAPLRLLWYGTAIDMNSTADQALTKYGTFTNFEIGFVRIANSSAAVNNAVGGLYTAASKGGLAVVGASQTYTSVTGAGLGTGLTIAAAGGATLSAANLYVSLSTPHGTAGTADWRVYGHART